MKIAGLAASLFGLIGSVLAQSATSQHSSSVASYLSPAALAASTDETKLYIACATAGQIAVFDLATSRVISRIQVPTTPLGLALSRDGKQLYVTCAAPESTVCVLDTATESEVARIPAGHTAMAPVLSPDGRILYVCERFNNDVGFVDLASGAITKRVAVPREPVAAAMTHDGKLLLVANHIHAGRSDVDFVAASVTVIDTGTARIAKELTLPNGSGLLRDIQISPDGRYACVTHQIGRFHLPTTQIERGWINSNALSLIDLGSMTLLDTVLLDEVDRGAANPWAAAWSQDGKTLCVTHAGTHELSVLDVPALLAKLWQLHPSETSGGAPPASPALHTESNGPNDLAFLLNLRQRIKLPAADRGPRAVILAGKKAYLANYFSDTLTVVNLAESAPCANSIQLAGSKPLTMTAMRRGELLFNDASICFQGWQSCASCHSSDARVDGLNWDNLNDGIGNPKNVKSLLLAHRTPPSMALGVREDAEFSVRAGIRHTLFSVRPEEEALAIDEYLKSLAPIPSPFLGHGRLSPAAERGKTLFMDGAIGCADCHTPPLFTNLQSYDVGTAGPLDKRTDRFDTPTLVEIWRTAPYLHDGRAATLREVLHSCNPADQHGRTSHLSRIQIDELVEYLLSL